MRKSPNYEAVAGELINNSVSCEPTLRLGEPKLWGVGPEIGQLNMAHVGPATAAERRGLQRLLLLLLRIRHDLNLRGVSSIETREKKLFIPHTLTEY
jgi:hypothetical protein